MGKRLLSGETRAVCVRGKDAALVILALGPHLGDAGRAGAWRVWGWARGRGKARVGSSGPAHGVPRPVVTASPEIMWFKSSAQASGRECPPGTQEEITVLRV